MAVTVYTKVACPYCARAMMELEEKGIEFEEVNLTMNRDRIPELIKLAGGRKVPVIVDDGKVTIGFNGAG
ncbi:MAG: glutaredoxin family protein [Thermincola sp.]|jgi:glutaredoxin|nr:glutaredoxin family protein [Thermincola sp.]MDT3702639.1 glutaredoxin family protein [Thermincola sp.]